MCGTKSRGGAPPGNANGAKAPGTHFVQRGFRIRPDQAERLALELNQSEAVRRALDSYFSIHPAEELTDDEWSAALDAMAEENN